MAISQYDPTIRHLVDTGLDVAQCGLGFSSGLYKAWEKTIAGYRDVAITMTDTEKGNTWNCCLFEVGLIALGPDSSIKHWR